MRFCTITLGCKANQYDTGIIENVLRSRGYGQARPGSGCDVCIINTCAVTAESVRKSKQAVRRVRRQEPGALIAVCGCLTALEQEEAAAQLGADIVGGTEDREGFASNVEKVWQQRRKNQSEIKKESVNSNCVTRTRALLKIQDGCSNNCAYCIIPQVRGPSRPVPSDEIANKATLLEQQGYKEIVITGIEISSYKPSLADAIEIVSANAPNARIRLGSLHPEIINAGFISRIKAVPNLCNHFHISLQSGCDEVLGHMGRSYRAGQVFDAVCALRDAYSNCGITADLITGFPGETEAYFEQTLAFMEKAAFSAMHVFPFSPRPGTRAVNMPDKIPAGIGRRRAKTASQVAMRLCDNFRRQQTGKVLDVLFETYKNGRSTGRSGNYLTVAVQEKIEKNIIKDIKITGVENTCITGEIAY